MNRAVYDVLSNLPGKKGEGPVFRRRDGAAWGDVRTAFEHACRRAKITEFRFHDLRHTCASGSSCAAGASRRCRRSSAAASSV